LTFVEPGVWSLSPLGHHAPTLGGQGFALDAPGEQAQQRGGDNETGKGGRERLDVSGEDAPGNEDAAPEEGHEQ
jgi:hypothetical protein